jgi:SAM-dependent methyltransferase
VKLAAVVVAFLAALAARAEQAKSSHPPDVIYVPTPQPVVDRMLELARVGPGDVVYDLGCGDGRIVVSAAKRGARATGIDIDPERVAEARASVQAAGVGDRARIVEGDLFQQDLHDATVVTLYLLPDLNLRLRPKLLELRPGTRIVSHAFNMGDWQPEHVEEVEGKTIYFWTVPEHRPRTQARTGTR